MAQPPLFLADGVSSSATHNGIHRIVLFQLSKDAKPTEIVEIAVPDKVLKDIVEALSRVLRK
jgi:hypothetical protein